MFQKSVVIFKILAKNTQLEEINIKQSGTIDDLTKKVSKITLDMESQLEEKNELIKKLQTDAKISKENQEKENKKFIDCEFLNDV